MSEVILLSPAEADDGVNNLQNTLISVTRQQDLRWKMRDFQIRSPRGNDFNFRTKKIAEDIDAVELRILINIISIFSAYILSHCRKVSSKSIRAYINFISPSVRVESEDYFSILLHPEIGLESARPNKSSWLASKK